MNLQTALNGQISNWSILYTKLHRFHWYVKGPLFFTLHEKFEELYNEAALTVDEVAERLLAIGGQPVATMKEYLETATLAETNNESKASEMVATLVSDYKAIKEQLVELAKLSEEQDDVITNDLATGLIEKIDTHVWMLTAYLGE
ncbi:DNA starvation/stationary phase protection protein [Robertmurraya yapensis]|uniref:DNA starvation/stationary phase protection protein n=1 Tax=Bacillus yapensis TaxID=2492960 RepID=A0A431VZ18_9BACI|nr:DNA starvation/stationary phase protection protein [Bacillus yapensis]RTR28458.1 DNA starvation/stationary phase protection protein [Bacillus yapensis]TKS94519.1 DNA starvation/stationary phase protection protein [Bacillus yapensis]